MAMLRENVMSHVRTLGNAHWGDQRDVRDLSEALDVGVLMFCDGLQSGGRECLYNIGATRDNFTYWVALWWQEPVHFRLAELSSAGSASHHGAEPSFRCFWSDADLPADLRRHYRQCNRLAN